MTALADIRVLDLGEGVAGPYAASLLGDMGADVVKLERPAGDWGRTSGELLDPEFSSCFLAMNRNKRGLGLDLSAPSGRAVALRLVERSDVLISNFRPGVMERLGLGYQDCRVLNPGLVYCSASAYGETGAYRDVPGNDTVMQAVSGISELIGEPDGPPLRVSFPVIDMCTALYLVQGVLAALRARAGGSAGVKLDLSLLNTAVTLQSIPFIEYRMNGRLPQRMGNQNPALCPAGAYLAGDDRYFSVSAVREHQWISLCSAIGRPELVGDPRFLDNTDRVAHRGELNGLLQDTFRHEDRSTWLTVLREADVPCSPVNTYADLTGDAGLAATLPRTVTMLDGYGAATTLVHPLRVDGQFPAARLPAPRRGQHTVAVLSDAGYTRQEIDLLVREGAAFTT